MMSHHALNLIVKYDGFICKNEGNFVNVPKRLLETAEVPMSINIATFKTFCHRSYDDDASFRVSLRHLHQIARHTTTQQKG